MIPARISCGNMFSVARQKVRVKGSYGQGYCFITLKHNYVSSRRLLHTLAIDCSLCFASVQHFCVFALPKKGMKRKTVEQSEAKTESVIIEDIPAWYPDIWLQLSKYDTRWQLLNLVGKVMIGIMKKTAPHNVSMQQTSAKQQNQLFGKMLQLTINHRHSIFVTWLCLMTLWSAFTLIHNPVICSLGALQFK